jgi:hypothetical protein
MTLTDGYIFMLPVAPSDRAAGFSLGTFVSPGIPPGSLGVCGVFNRYQSCRYYDVIYSVGLPGIEPGSLE